MDATKKMMDFIAESLSLRKKLAPRQIKPKYAVVATELHPHYFSGRLSRVRKDVRRSKELLTKPEYAGVKTRQVEVRVLEKIDHSRYIGEGLRQLRAERGVGKYAPA